MKFKKKPVEIEAEIYKEGMEDGFEERFTHYLNPNSSYGIQTSEDDVEVQVPYIETLEGRHLITMGDWIITGIKGERYPCKADIFELTYDAVDQSGVIDMNNNVKEWLLNGERGASSDTIVSTMEGITISSIWRGMHPHDPADFWRCVKLLNAVPEYRSRLDELRPVSPQWDSLVDHWAELEGMLNDNAHEMYDRMKELGC